MASKQDFTVVVDIGTTKITALAGEMNANRKIELLGKAMVSSRGIRRGVVLNPGEFAMAVQSLISQLESQVGGKIRIVDVSMAGQGVRTTTYEGFRYIESGLVSQSDVDYLEKEAFNMPLEPGYRVYHIFPRNYEIGDDSSVTIPVGHEGRKMTARYTLVTAPASYQESVERALDRIGVQLGEFVLSPLATASAVISHEEKEVGVAVVDIGGGSTKLTTWSEGVLTYMAVIPFAGEVITRDIKEGCSILLKWAEQLKTQYGQAMGDFADEEKVVTIPGHNGWEPKEISFKSLAFIIQARLEEIIDSLYFHIEKSGFFQQPAQGIVLTGGTSRMVNILQLVKFRTGMDARLGFSRVRMEGNSDLDITSYLTALGLLQRSLRHQSPAPVRKKTPGATLKEKNPDKKTGNGFLTNLGKKVSQQISLIFEDEDANM